jgi:hypothetical protein
MKFVREQLYEKFTEEGDPIEDLGIGIVARLNRQIESLFQDTYFDNYVNEIIITDDGKQLILILKDFLIGIENIRIHLSEVIHNLTSLSDYIIYPKNIRTFSFSKYSNYKEFYVCKVRKEHRDLFKQLNKEFINPKLKFLFQDI